MAQKDERRLIYDYNVSGVGDSFIQFARSRIKKKITFLGNCSAVFEDYIFSPENSSAIAAHTFALKLSNKKPKNYKALKSMFDDFLNL
jgi:hypothetical protein